MVEKAWQQGHEAADHLAPAVRKKGEMIVGAQLPLSTFMQSETPAPDTIPHIFKTDHPTSDKLG